MILKFHVEAVPAGMCDRINSYRAALKLRQLLGAQAEIDYFWKKCCMCDCDFDDLFIVPDFVNLRKEGNLEDTYRGVRLRLRFDRQDRTLIENDIKKYLHGSVDFKGLNVGDLRKIGVDEFCGDTLYLSVGLSSTLYCEKGVLSNNELELTPPLDSKVEELRGQLRLDKNVIGICVRGTDKRKTIEMGTRMDRQFENIMNKVRNILAENPEQRFFLVTDDLEYRDIFLSNFPQATVRRKDEVFPPQGGGVSAKPGRSRTKENILDAVVNLWLLAHTNYNDRVPLDIKGSHFVRFPLYLAKP